MIHYSLYDSQTSITHDELCALNKAASDLLARAENSGSEGFYTEVARWSYQRERWERYCFAKFLGGENDLFPDYTPHQLASHYAAAINDAAGPEQADLPLIHKMPTAP